MLVIDYEINVRLAVKKIKIKIKTHFYIYATLIFHT